MGAVHYWNTNKEISLLPSRPINAAAEIGLLLRAEDAKLTATTRKTLADIQEFLTGPVLDEIHQLTGHRPGDMAGAWLDNWRRFGNKFWAE